MLRTTVVQVPRGSGEGQRFSNNIHRNADFNVRDSGMLLKPAGPLDGVGDGVWGRAKSSISFSAIRQEQPR